LTRLVPGRHGLASHRANRRVGDIKVVFSRGSFLQKLTSTVAQQLMDTDLDFKGGIAAAAEDLLVLLSDERNGLIWSLGAENIAKRHVLEAQILADIVVVGKVDAGRKTRASEAQNFQGGEVRAEELVLLEVSSPGKLGDHALGTVH
jgi:hypothetical protein